jgi:hypothetical protein
MNQKNPDGPGKPENPGQQPPNGQHGPEVTITVDNKPVQIHRGRRSVAEIKSAGGVPLADDLEQVIDGEMKLLPDDGHVVIHGGEVFVSHPKSTSSS